MNLRSLQKSPLIYKTLVAVRSVAGRGWMRLQHRLRGIRPQRVFFSSFRGKAYCDSPRFISEALHRLRPDLEIVWQLSRNAYDADVPGYVHTVHPRSLKALSMIATSRCLVDNFNRPMYMPKFPEQLYIQTWHGDRGFKKCQLDMDPSAPYPDGAQMDLAVSGSEFGNAVYRSAFGYAGKILCQGIPRNDLLIHPASQRMRKVRTRLNIKEDVRILTYAPTFRDTAVGEPWTPPFDISHLLSLLQQAHGGEWTCLVRGHDLCGNARVEGAMDVSNYPEMAEILMITDILITDYSSCAGDFVLTGRRVILYQPDRADFVRDDRALYMDPSQTGYRIAQSLSELEAHLTSSEDDRARDEAILRYYGAVESGHAAQSVAEYISSALSAVQH